MAVFKKNRSPIPKIIGAALAMIFGQKYENDTLVLSNGRHEIEIQLDQDCHRRGRGRHHHDHDHDHDGKIEGRIWVSFDDNCGDMPVCGGNVDKLGIVKTHRGFILHAEIHSTSRTVRWFASLG